MATVAQDVEQIRNATYGGEVREAIADGIQQSYNIVQKMDRLVVDAASTAAGSEANATISEVTSGGQRCKKIVFSIPRGATGPQGSPGATPNISIGTVTTGAAGSNASVTKTGTALAPVFNFTIPRGAKGDDGQDAAVGSFALEYSDSSTYGMGDFCTYGAKLYRCTTPITTPKAWSASDWTVARMSRAVMGAARIVDISKFPDANNAPSNRIYVIPSAAGQTASNYVLNLPYAQAVGTLATFGWQTGTGNDAVGSIQLFVNTAGSVYTRYKTGTNSFTAWTNISAQADPLLLLSVFAPEYISVSGGTYSKDDLVVYNGSFYRAKTDGVPTGTWNASNWVATFPLDYFAQKVNTAADRVDFLYNFYARDFSTSVTYYPGDIVKYNGSHLYIFLKTHTPGAMQTGEITEITSPMTIYLRDSWQSIANQYSDTQTYSVGDFVMRASALYKCNTAILAAEEWTPAHWSRVPVGNQLKNYEVRISGLENNKYNVLTNVFNASTSYSKGHYVIYNDQLWIFTQAHTGAWDQTHVVAAGNLSNHITNLASTMAPRYSDESTYMPGDFVTYGSALFRCNTKIDPPEAWNVSHWTNTWLLSYWVLARELVGPIFSETTTYSPGQYVIYNDNLYRVLRSHYGTWNQNNFSRVSVMDTAYNLGGSLANRYNPAVSYKIDDYCEYNGATYRCIQDINSLEDFTPSHWTRVNALGLTDTVASYIAPKFSAAKRYGIGEYCVRNNQLYRFTSQHLEGAWNANDVEQANLSDAMSGVSTGVILKSPNGTRFQLTVANDGTLTASALE